jgi:hypothetical protein
MFPPNRGSGGSRRRRSRTATNRQYSDASLVNPATQPVPIVTGGHVQSDDHGSRHNTSRRVESHDGYGRIWAAGSHTIGYNPHGYTNISPALVNSRHLGVDGLAPGSPSSMTDDTGSDSWLCDSSQTNYSFGPETTSMDTSNGFYPGSSDGRDVIPPAQDVAMWGLSQQFQPFTDHEASPLRVPVGLMPEFQGVPATVREYTSQPWSSLQPPQGSVPVIVVSEHPNPPGFYPSHTWVDTTNPFTTSIGCSDQSLAFETSTTSAVYPEVNYPMPLSTDSGSGGSRDFGMILDEVSAALSYPLNDESVPRSV